MNMMLHEDEKKDMSAAELTKSKFFSELATFDGHPEEARDRRGSSVISVLEFSGDDSVMTKFEGGFVDLKLIFLMRISPWVFSCGQESEEAWFIILVCTSDYVFEIIHEKFKVLQKSLFRITA